MGVARLRPILFTDESRFCLDFHDGRRRVWRARGERFMDEFVTQHDRFGGGSLMVWGGISYDGTTELYLVQWTLTGVRYKHEVLHPIVRSFASAIGEDLVLMDDNTRPHRARAVTAFLEQECIQCMDWPALSPDLNPIEHAWDLLQRRLSARDIQPQTLPQLAEALADEWSRIPIQEILNLIHSFPRRCRAVVAARGGHTRYSISINIDLTRFHASSHCQKSAGYAIFRVGPSRLIILIVSIFSKTFATNFLEAVGQWVSFALKAFTTPEVVIALLCTLSNI